MRFCRPPLLIAAALAMGVAARAEAGAPNYECQAGRLRIGIDQHRRAGLARVTGGSVQAVTFVDANQNGPSLDLTVTINSRKATVRVRGTGSAMSIADSGGTVNGSCAFVPGDHALGHVTASKLVLRASPSVDATHVAVVARGSLVWSAGRFDEPSGRMLGTTDWTRIRAVVSIRGGSVDGGDQVLGMGSAAGRDGRSVVIDGWARMEGIKLLGPPGP